MQEIPIQINYISAIIFIGIFLGLFLSFFFIMKSIKSKSPNLYMGFLLLVLGLVMLEGWLNYTGYIFRILHLTNFSEPLNFAIAPLIYLFTVTQLDSKKNKGWWLHFIPMIFWLCYCLFFFALSVEFKYNDNLKAMDLPIAFLEIDQPYTGDPLSIRDYINRATILHILIYLVIILWQLLKAAKLKNEKILTTKNTTLVSLRNSFYHFLVITIILLYVKSNLTGDVGDYLIFLYITFMVILTTFHVLNTSNYFSQTSSFLEGPTAKYRKSSLVDDHKDVILEAIVNQLKNEKYYLKSTASLSGLSKTINESSHHVSQVINEKLNMSFFELIAQYRVDEAKSILKTNLGKNLTIEEIAERVGYNSKSAFNTAFKKFASQTPSQFRDS